MVRLGKSVYICAAYGTHNALIPEHHTSLPATGHEGVFEFITEYEPYKYSFVVRLTGCGRYFNQMVTHLILLCIRSSSFIHDEERIISQLFVALHVDLCYLADFISSG